MELELLKDVLNAFYKLNGFPVFILEDGRPIFQTLPERFLSRGAARFFQKFDAREGITVFGKIEYYAALPYSDGVKRYKTIVGPVFSAHPMTVGYRGRLAVEELLDAGRFKDFMISVSLTGESAFTEYVSLISKLTGGGSVNFDKVERCNVSLHSALDRARTEKVFRARENLLSPYAPETERRILDMVRVGDVDGVKKINTSFAADAPGQNVGYLFKVVSLVAIATRAAADSGVDADLAYGLSDAYLERLGKAGGDRQIADIAKNVLPHFASLVLENRENGVKKYSPHIARAEKYVKSHLHYRLTLAETAAEIGISEKYLSRLFVTHKGEKFTAYVNRCRVGEAKELLLNTDYSLTEISYSLGFVSESYFIKVFGEVCGLTPGAYRLKHKSKA